MERIKEALEKARQGRKPFLQPPANEEGFPASNRDSSDKVKSSPLPPVHDLQELNYRHTKVVEINQKHLEKMRIVAHNKHDVHSNVFDILRTQVVSKMSENGWKTLAVVSPAPEAGKSVVAINLAMSIAQFAEKSAMLVDFDLRRPSVARYLGLEDGTSLSDVIEGTCELKDALVNPGIPRLVVLPCQHAMTKTAEVLASKKIKYLIDDIRNRYEERIVIFDLPPLLNADDALAVLPHIDCVLLVIANGMTTQRQIEECLRYLPPSKMVGTVFNKVNMGAQDYSYY